MEARTGIEPTIDPVIEDGGEGRNRTGDRAFAEPCLTTWLPRLEGRETVSVKAEKSIVLDTAQLTAVIP